MKHVFVFALALAAVALTAPLAVAQDGDKGNGFEARPRAKAEGRAVLVLRAKGGQSSAALADMLALNRTLRQKFAIVRLDSDTGKDSADAVVTLNVNSRMGQNVTVIMLLLDPETAEVLDGCSLDFASMDVAAAGTADLQGLLPYMSKMPVQKPDWVSQPATVAGHLIANGSATAREGSSGGSWVYAENEARRGILQQIQEGASAAVSKMLKAQGWQGALPMLPAGDWLPATNVLPHRRASLPQSIGGDFVSYYVQLKISAADARPMIMAACRAYYRVATGSFGPNDDVLVKAFEAWLGEKQGVAPAVEPVQPQPQPQPNPGTNEAVYEGNCKKLFQALKQSDQRTLDDLVDYTALTEHLRGDNTPEMDRLSHKRFVDTYFRAGGRWSQYLKDLDLTLVPPIMSDGNAVTLRFTAKAANGETWEIRVKLSPHNGRIIGVTDAKYCPWRTVMVRIMHNGAAYAIPESEYLSAQEQYAAGTRMPPPPWNKPVEEPKPGDDGDNKCLKRTVVNNDTVEFEWQITAGAVAVAVERARRMSCLFELGDELAPFKDKIAGHGELASALLQACTATLLNVNNQRDKVVVNVRIRVTVSTFRTWAKRIK